MNNKVNSSHLEPIYKHSQLIQTQPCLIFIPAILIIVLLCFFSYYQINKLITVNSGIAHTYKVIEATDSSLNDLSSIASLQSAYLITGDTKFLSEIAPLKLNLKRHLNLLTRIVEDNSLQTERVKEFIDLINKGLVSQNQVIQLNENTKLNTIEGIELFHSSNEFTNRAKDLGNEIKSVELTLLSERNNTSVNHVRIINSVLIISSIISILFVVFALILFHNELKRRIKSEQSKNDVELRLRSIIESASDMIAALDMNQRFIIFNEAYSNSFKKFLGKSLAIGMSLEDVSIDTPETRLILELWRSSLAGEEYTKNIEFSFDKEKHFYEITSSLITNNDNAINGAVHIIRDITKITKEQIKLKDSYKHLDIGMKTLEEKNEQISLLVEMSDILLACNSQEEISHVMPKYCNRLFQYTSGYLYIMQPSKNYLEKAASWGTPNIQEDAFAPYKCWAIRRGRLHHVNSAQDELDCEHVPLPMEYKTSYLCLPLMAQNDIYGLLHIEAMDENQSIFSPNMLLLINAFSELTALALANARLRENLRYESIRDPLTGLYNRRYLEDFLLKQIDQAARSHNSLSILMVDLDHFKKINDTYGHDSGDAALKEIGRILQRDIRVGDVVARYGGEEFIIMFYNTDIETAKTRANTIREEISMLQVKYGAQLVSKVTVSIGIAGYPQNGKKPTKLIERADQALFFAKKNGRNHVVAFSDIDNLSD